MRARATRILISWAILAVVSAPAQADPEEDPDAPALDRAERAYARGDYNKAVTTVDEVLAGKDVGARQEARRLQVRMFLDGGFFGAAEKELETAFAEARKAKQSDAPLLVERGELRWRQARWADADTDLAAAIDRLADDGRDRDVARAFVVAGRLLIDRGQADDALGYADQAIAYLDRVEGEHSVDAAEARAVRGLVARAAGDLATAQAELAAAVDTTAARLGRYHPRTLGLAVELAAIEIDRGDYGDAERSLDEAADRLAELFGSNVMMARPIVEQARMFAAIGDMVGAEAYAQYAFDLAESLPINHPLVLEIVLREAEALAALGAPQGADFFAKLRGVVVEGSPSDFRLEMVAAISAYVEGDLQRASSALDQLAGVTPALPGDRAELLWLRGRLNVEQDSEAAAADAFGKAAAVLEKLSPGHPRRATMMFEKGQAQLRAGEVAAAFATWTDAAELRDRAFLGLGRATDPTRRAYLRLAAHEMDVVVAAQLEKAGNDRAAIELAARLVLRRKGRLLDLQSAYLDTVRKRGNSSDLHFIGEVQSATAALAALTLLGDDAAQSWADRLIELGDAFARRANAEAKAEELIELETITGALPDGAALIEIVGYADRYGAYVVGAGGPVAAFDLGPRVDLDAASTALRALLRDPASPLADVRRAGHQLWKLLWKPLARRVGGARRVLVSADGALNLVPFAAMVDDGGAYLVQTTAISYLASARDVLDFGQRGTARTGPLLVGAPDFGVQPSRPGPGDLLAGMLFTDLPGTADEIAAISPLLPRSRTISAGGAIEADVAMVQAPEILHVATHGFFLSDEGAIADGTRGITVVKGAAPADSRSLDPLLRAGLALAGANRRTLDGERDGILTASELATVDLLGTKLVVMSACDTGMGEASVGDGVFGLRRAVSIAGAQTQVMTLWMVSDAATRDLMIAFYRNLTAGQGRADALQRGQLELLAAADTAHPYFWASFLVAGDPSNLDGQPTLPPVGRGARGCGCSTDRDASGGAVLVLLALLLSSRRRRPRPRGAVRCRSPRAGTTASPHGSRDPRRLRGAG